MAANYHKQIQGLFRFLLKGFWNLFSKLSGCHLSTAAQKCELHILPLRSAREKRNVTSRETGRCVRHSKTTCDNAFGVLWCLRQPSCYSVLSPAAECGLWQLSQVLDAISADSLLQCLQQPLSMIQCSVMHLLLKLSRPLVNIWTGASLRTPSKQLQPSAVE